MYWSSHMFSECLQFIPSTKYKTANEVPEAIILKSTI